MRADAAVAPSVAPADAWRQRGAPWNTEAYARIEENRFLPVATSPVSTFSIDVDAASYSNVRRFLSQGALPPADAVRLEEMVNYFSYRYPDRAGEHPFGLIADAGPCSWADDHRLVRVALQARRVDTRELPPSNLVFLIDVSGSMQSPDKLPLVKPAFRALVQESPARSASSRPTAAARAGASSPSPRRSTRPGRSPATCATPRSCWVDGRTIRRTRLRSIVPVPDYEAAVGKSVKGMKIGIPKEYRIDGMPAEIETLWQKGIDWLKAAGAEIVDISLPHTKYALPAYYIVAPAEASSNLARYDGVRYGLRVPGKDIVDMYEKTRAAGFGGEVRAAS